MSKSKETFRKELFSEDQTTVNMAILDIAVEHVYQLVQGPMKEENPGKPFEPLKKFQRTLEAVVETWRSDKRLPTMLQLYILLRMDEVFTNLDETIRKSLPGISTAMEAVEAEKLDIYALRAGQVLCALTHLLQFLFLYGRPNCLKCCSWSDLTYMSSTLIDAVFGLCPRFAQERESSKWHLVIDYAGLPDLDRPDADLPQPSQPVKSYILGSEASLDRILSPQPDGKRSPEATRIEGVETDITNFLDDRIVHVDYNIDLPSEILLDSIVWAEAGDDWKHWTPIVPRIRTGGKMQSEYSTLLEYSVPLSVSLSRPEEEEPCIHRLHRSLTGERRGGVIVGKSYYKSTGRGKRRRKVPPNSRNETARERESYHIKSMLQAYVNYRPQTELPKRVSCFTRTDTDEKVDEMVQDVLLQINDVRRGAYLRQAMLGGWVRTRCWKHEDMCTRLFVRKPGWEYVFEKVPEVRPGRSEEELADTSWVLVRCLPLRHWSFGVDEPGNGGWSCCCVETDNKRPWTMVEPDDTYESQGRRKRRRG